MAWSVLSARKQMVETVAVNTRFSAKAAIGGLAQIRPQFSI
jgi:hypothetical protein